MARQIEPKMVAFLDEKLKSNGLAQHAIEAKDARLLATEAAKVCVGIREKTGNNDGPMVELIQETIGGHDHEAWCQSFVQTCIAYAELKTGIKSPLVAGEHCLSVWEDTPHAQRVKMNPLPGALCIWRHGNSSNGHTGIVLGADEETMHLVEGNTTAGQTPEGKVVREGGGVYYTVRSRKGSGDMHVVGFLRPFA
jgi:hypothetical protein